MDLRLEAKTSQEFSITTSTSRSINLQERSRSFQSCKTETTSETSTYARKDLSIIILEAFQHDGCSHSDKPNSTPPCKKYQTGASREQYARALRSLQKDVGTINKRSLPEKVLNLIDLPGCQLTRSGSEKFWVVDIFLEILKELQLESHKLVCLERDGSTMNSVSSPLLILIKQCFWRTSEDGGLNSRYPLRDIIKLVVECVQIIEKSIHKQADAIKSFTGNTLLDSNARIAKRMLKFIMRNVQDELNNSEIILEIVNSDMNNQAFTFIFGLLKHFIEKFASLLKLGSTITIKRSGNPEPSECSSKDANSVHLADNRLDKFTERLDKLLEKWGSDKETRQEAERQIVIDCYHCQTKCKKQEMLLKTVSQFTEGFKNEIMTHVKSFRRDSQQKQKCQNMTRVPTLSDDTIRSDEISALEASTNHSMTQNYPIPQHLPTVPQCLPISFIGRGPTRYPKSFRGYFQKAREARGKNEKKCYQGLQFVSKKEEERLQRTATKGKNDAMNDKFVRCHRRSPRRIRNSDRSPTSCNRGDAGGAAHSGPPRIWDSYAVQPVYEQNDALGKKDGAKENSPEKFGEEASDATSHQKRQRKRHHKRHRKSGEAKTKEDDSKSVNEVSDETKHAEPKTSETARKEESGGVEMDGQKQVDVDPHPSTAKSNETKKGKRQKGSVPTKIQKPSEPEVAKPEFFSLTNSPESDIESPRAAPNSLNTSEPQKKEAKEIVIQQKVDPKIVEFLLGTEARASQEPTSPRQNKDNEDNVQDPLKGNNPTHCCRLSCKCSNKRQAGHHKKSCCRAACTCVPSTNPTPQVVFTPCSCNLGGTQNVSELTNRPIYQFFTTPPVSCTCPGRPEPDSRAHSAISPSSSEVSSTRCRVSQDVETQTSRKGLLKSTENSSSGMSSKTPSHLHPTPTESDSSCTCTPANSEGCAKTQDGACVCPEKLEEMFQDFDDKYSRVIRELKCLIKEGYIPLTCSDGSSKNHSKEPSCFKPPQVEIRPCHCKNQGGSSKEIAREPLHYSSNNSGQSSTRTTNSVYQDLQREIEHLRQMVKNTNFGQCSCCKCCKCGSDGEASHMPRPGYKEQDCEEEENEAKKYGKGYLHPDREPSSNAKPGSRRQSSCEGEDYGGSYQKIPWDKYGKGFRYPSREPSPVDEPGLPKKPSRDKGDVIRPGEGHRKVPHSTQGKGVRHQDRDTTLEVNREYPREPSCDEESARLTGKDYQKMPSLTSQDIPENATVIHASPSQIELQKEKLPPSVHHLTSLKDLNSREVSHIKTTPTARYSAANVTENEPSQMGALKTRKSSSDYGKPESTRSLKFQEPEDKNMTGTSDGSGRRESQTKPSGQSDLVLPQPATQKLESRRTSSRVSIEGSPKLSRASTSQISPPQRVRMSEQRSARFSSDVTSKPSPLEEVNADQPQLIQSKVIIRSGMGSLQQSTIDHHSSSVAQTTTLQVIPDERIPPFEAAPLMRPISPRNTDQSTSKATFVTSKPKDANNQDLLVSEGSFHQQPLFTDGGFDDDDQGPEYRALYESRENVSIELPSWTEKETVYEDKILPNRGEEGRAGALDEKPKVDAARGRKQSRLYDGGSKVERQRRRSDFENQGAEDDDDERGVQKLRKDDGRKQGKQDDGGDGAGRQHRGQKQSKDDDGGSRVGRWQRGKDYGKKHGKQEAGGSRSGRLQGDTQDEDDECVCPSASDSESTDTDVDECQAILDTVPCNLFSDSSSTGSSFKELSVVNNGGNELYVMIIQPQIDSSTDDIVKTVVVSNNAKNKLTSITAHSGETILENKNPIDTIDQDKSVRSPKKGVLEETESQHRIIQKLCSRPPVSEKVASQKFNFLAVKNSRRLINSSTGTAATAYNCEPQSWEDTEMNKKRRQSGGDLRSIESLKTSEKEVQVTKWNAKVQTAGPRKFNRTDISRAAEDKLAVYLGLERTNEDGRSIEARDRVPDCQRRLSASGSRDSRKRTTTRSRRN